MDAILSALKWKYSVLCLNGIFPYAPRHQETRRNIRYRYSVYWKTMVSQPKWKVCFLTNCINHVVHVIMSEKLKDGNHKADAIQKLQPAATMTVRRSVHRLYNAFKIFVSNFAKISSLLLKRLRKSQARELGLLTEKELSALENFKEKLISPPVLTLPERTRQYTLYTDSCDRHVRCIQLRRQKDITTR